jgi:hypothetical protein
VLGAKQMGENEVMQTIGNDLDAPPAARRLVIDAAAVLMTTPSRS